MPSLTAPLPAGFEPARVRYYERHRDDGRTVMHLQIWRAIISGKQLRLHHHRCGETPGRVLWHGRQ